jgi:hypothetical protein
MIRPRIPALAIPILALLITAMGAGAALALPKTWSKACLVCRQNCDDNYPAGDASRGQCYHLCVISGSCTSTTGAGLRAGAKPKPKSQ